MITLIQYNDPGYTTRDGLSPAEASKLLKPNHINWFDVEITNKILVEDTAQFFGIHHLMAEDIQNLEQLPKFEVFDKYLFFTLKMLVFNPETNKITQEHLSIVMGEDLIITFQEGLPGDVFDELRNRIALAKGRIRKYGADYLFYNIIDSVVDNYMTIMERLRDKIEKLEAEIIKDPSFHVVEEIMEIKKEINTLRKYTLPLRDALNKMRVEGSHFIQKTSVNYFQDVADHIHYLISSFETSREMLKDIMDLHLSNLSNDMNKVMKTLTVVAAIFIPLTFIAGVYGMNFKYMPELDSPYGYPMLWTFMIVSSVVMVVYMKHKKWL
ncbi:MULTISPECIES: magnesium/cobalt transporter CorA [unclassified Imperialibacter]|uniref:magnesium/cobalt transporter CorA n=1 Tax=unclassified Imperialibacter TaxID=2629706 RepID=UPI00125C4A54|nr:MULTISPECIES: magnesium/cobalt transporter CorA [unclassified Imperialibacter]CAD5248269.1 Cobalt/magnesium transport protein CorA [Imperialibacter sp. 75]CAD5248402.1 Cobalt/magnesium transport protein CorA [Imperialibacter sp. 89]VVS97637.1 Cobalt/magnesium transport protein CorA [Imperialibacter sp. EC-SDR9]